MKKRSPASASSCSSSSSNFDESEAILIDQSEKPSKTKRPRKNNNQTRKQNVKSSNSSSGRRRSSIYRGVTRHRWTGRFEAHLWDKSTWNNAQKKKGRQVYLGAYDSEEAAARTYDLAALKYWGPDTNLNFPVDKYTKEREEMQNVTREEYLATLRRRSSGFSRGVSKYRGVARHHQNGRWEARIGRVSGNKYLYLGTYNTQEAAAAAYDVAAIKYRGANAVTNFDISNYTDELKNKILPSSNQSKPQLIPNSSSTHDPEQVETEVDQQQHEEEEQLQQKEDEDSTQVQYSCEQLLSYIETIKIMAGVNVLDLGENDHHWSFLDTPGFAQRSVPDLTLDRHLELPDISFDDTAGFEDNIDLIFGERASSDGNDDVNLSGVLDDIDATTTGFKVIEEVGASGNSDDNEQQRNLPSSSPTSSTTTLVSSFF